MKRATFITTEQLKVGAVILVALLILLVTGYKLGQAANLFTTRYELIAFLPDGFGLREGGQVQVAGQPAGTIKSIEFLPVDGDTTMLVTPSSCCSFMISRVIVPVVSGSSPEVGSS